MNEFKAFCNTFDVHRPSKIFPRLIIGRRPVRLEEKTITCKCWLRRFLHYYFRATLGARFSHKCSQLEQHGIAQYWQTPGFSAPVTEMPLKLYQHLHRLQGALGMLLGTSEHFPGESKSVQRPNMKTRRDVYVLPVPNIELW